jgi:hypothetical protein
MRRSIFATILGLLLSGLVISLALGWHEADVRAWWPLILAAGTLLACVYASLFALLLPSVSSRTLRVALIWNLAITSILVLHSALFHWLPIDWLAVNEGAVQLTWFQQLVRSDATPYLVLLSGLAMPVTMRLIHALKAH